MNKRERVRMALNHQEPDRVPMDLGGTLVSTIHKGSYEDLLKYTGLEDNNMEILSKFSNTVKVGPAIRERLDVDFINIRMKPAASKPDIILPEDGYIDEWGIEWEKAKLESGIYYPVKNPLIGKDITAVENYIVPDMSDPTRIAGLAEYAKEMYETTDYALIADGNWLLMQKGYDLLGIEDFLCDMMVDTAKINKLLQKIFDSTIAAIQNFVAALGPYVEVVTVADDLGTQDGPMISPAKYKEVIKPYHKMIVDEIRKYTDAKIMLHSDGAIADFIPDVIDAGFDILNPIQTSARGMDSKFLKKEYGKDLCFWGGVDTQTIMPTGSPEDVEKEVKERIDDLAEGGGYVFGTVHIITHDIKPENIIACYDTARTYGVYK